MPPFAPPGPSFVADLAAHGDRPALNTPERTWTYGELDAAVGTVADRLGATRRLVLIEAANEVPALVAYLAALRGRHPVMLAPAGRPDAARQLHTIYDPDVVVTAEDGWAIRQRRAGTAHDLHPELALLLSTSGTTGSPKLVRLSGTNVSSNAAAIATYLELGPDDRAVTTLPLQYCYGLSVVHSHLHVGASIVLTDLSVVDRCFWDAFRRCGVTRLAGVPHTFELLDRVGFEAMRLPTLRSVTQAGGRLHPDRVRRYARLGAEAGWDFVVMYGQTEATARMAYLPPHLAADHPGAIGVPIPGGSLTIEEPDAEGVGELVYRGDNVMLGYAEQPADLCLGRSVTELRTGDLGRRNEAGLFEVVGRRSRFIKPFGVRIDLDRVEQLLADRAVTALATGDDERLVLGVEGEGATDVVPLLAEELGVPASVVRAASFPELPRLATGKPDYAAVLASVAEPTAEDEANRARRGVASTLDEVRAVVAECLGVTPGPDDSFVSLGGDSLSYVEVATRLEAVLGQLPSDWHTRTLADLAAGATRRRRITRADTSMVMRAVAIVLVVGHHAGSIPVIGGAHVLLAVAGYNFGRFKRDSASMAATAARVAVPAMLWTTMLALVSPDWAWQNAVLLNSWLGADQDNWGYWYLEVMVQTVLVLAALFLIPAVRAIDRRAPFGFALGIAAIGLAVRFDVLVTMEPSRHWSRPTEVLWLFALGWAAACATTVGRRLAVTTLLVVAVPGFFGEDLDQRTLVVLVGSLLVTWLPFVPLPRIVARAAAVLSAASLYTYLTHFQVYRPLAHDHGALVATVGSLLVGIAVWLVARRITTAAEQAIRRWWPRRGRRSALPVDGPPVPLDAPGVAPPVEPALAAWIAEPAPPRELPAGRGRS